jgi:hypothetical protein
VTSQKTHDTIVVGQLRVEDYIAGRDLNPPVARGVDGWLRDGVQVTFQSFWGQFGWMGVPMTRNIYLVLLVFTGFVVVGAVMALARFRRALTPPQWSALILLAAVGLMAFVETVAYNLKFVQFQGRYLYPGLIPMALFVAVGLAGWAALIARRLPLARWAIVGVVCVFAALDVYALFRIILPALT